MLIRVGGPGGPGGPGAGAIISIDIFEREVLKSSCDFVVELVSEALDLLGPKVHEVDGAHVQRAMPVDPPARARAHSR